MIMTNKKIQKIIESLGETENIGQKFYENMLLNKVISIFKYTNVPDSLSIRYLEESLIYYSNVGITKNKGGTLPSTRDGSCLIAVLGGTCGDIDVYGYGTDFCYSGVNVSATEKIGKDIVVGWNNKARTPSIWLIRKYADLLETCDKSLKIALVNTRLTKGFSCNTDSERVQIERAMDDIRNGKFMTVTSSNDLSELGIESHFMESFDLGYPQRTDVISDLLLAHEEILSQFCYEIGINLSVRDKKAQLIGSEIKGYDNYSKINVDDMLDCRKEMCEEINAVFGTNITVDFSDAIKSQKRAEQQPETTQESDDVGQNVDEGGVNDVDK